MQHCSATHPQENNRPWVSPGHHAARARGTAGRTGVRLYSLHTVGHALRPMGSARTASTSVKGDLEALLADQALVGVAWAAGGALWDGALLVVLQRWSFSAAALCRVASARLSCNAQCGRSSPLPRSADCTAQMPAECAAGLSQCLTVLESGGALASVCHRLMCGVCMLLYKTADTGWGPRKTPTGMRLLLLGFPRKRSCTRSSAFFIRLLPLLMFRLGGQK